MQTSKDYYDTKILLLSIPFLSFTPVFPSIVEHDSFESILDYLDEDDNHRYTLVILELIILLAQTSILGGSDQWVAHEMKKRMDEGMTPREAWLAIKDSTLQFNTQSIYCQLKK